MKCKIIYYMINSILNYLNIIVRWHSTRCNSPYQVPLCSPPSSLETYSSCVVVPRMSCDLSCHAWPGWCSAPDPVLSQWWTRWLHQGAGLTGSGGGRLSMPSLLAWVRSMPSASISLLTFMWVVVCHILIDFQVSEWDNSGPWWRFSETWKSISIILSM